MITLTKHIENLLLEHDCVIIPGFGGFISNYSEARYDDNRGVLLAPKRTVGFNQQLQINDGLLVQSYMSVYDASYPAAHLQMEKEIEQMERELNLNGYYDLGTIGRLTKDIGERISFDCFDSELITPSLCGLHSFEMQPVQSIITQRSIEKKMQEASIGISEKERHQDEMDAEKDKKREIVIRVNQRWIDFGVSVAAAVLLFFGISYAAMKDVATESDTVIAATYPVPNSNMPQNDVMARRNAKSKIVKEKKADSETLNTDVSNVKSVEAKKEVDAKTSATEVEKKSKEHKEDKIKGSNSDKADEKPQNTPKYTIVLASYVTRTNAESYIEQMKKEGYKDAEYVKKGKVSRIIYSGYATESEAQKALSDLRNQSKEFAEAWVMSL